MYIANAKKNNQTEADNEEVTADTQIRVPQDFRPWELLDTTIKVYGYSISLNKKNSYK